MDPYYQMPPLQYEEYTQIPPPLQYEEYTQMPPPLQYEEYTQMPPPLQYEEYTQMPPPLQCEEYTQMPPPLQCEEYTQMPPPPPPSQSPVILNIQIKDIELAINVVKDEVSAIISCITADKSKVIFNKFTKITNNFAEHLKNNLSKSIQEIKKRPMVSSRLYDKELEGISEKYKEWRKEFRVVYDKVEETIIENNFEDGYEYIAYAILPKIIDEIKYEYLRYPLYDLVGLPK